MNADEQKDAGCHGFGVFDKAVASLFDGVLEDHGLTKDGKTVAPLFADFCSKWNSLLSTHVASLQVVTTERL